MSNLPAVKALCEKAEVSERITDVYGDDAKIFISSIVNAVAGNAELQKCTPESIVGAAFKALPYRFLVDSVLGHAYIVPYKGRAQFQLGYKGLIQLALRSRMYKKIITAKIFADEIENYNTVTGEVEFVRNPDSKMRYDGKSKPCGYYAKIEEHSGFIAELYLPTKSIEEHGKRFSKSYGSSGSAWTTNFDAMAEKTVLIKVLNKYGQLSFNALAVINDSDSDESPETESHEPIQEAKETIKRGKIKKETVVDAVVEAPAETQPEAPVEEKDPFDD